MYVTLLPLDTTLCVLQICVYVMVEKRHKFVDALNDVTTNPKRSGLGGMNETTEITLN